MGEGRRDRMGGRGKGRSVGSEARAGLTPIVITVAKQAIFCSWLSKPAEPLPVNRESTVLSVRDL